MHHDPRVPETLEGWCVLLQMFRLRWREWTTLQGPVRRGRGAETVAALASMNRPGHSATALSTLLGHKGDLMAIHFRSSFEELQAAQLAMSRSPLSAFVEPLASYVSVVELGMYEMTGLIHGRLAERGLAAGSDVVDQAFDAEMEEQKKRVSPRLFLEVPRRRYVCFYPMNKHRGEQRNWYALSFEERAKLMREHGLVGRRYAGAVTQVISGSIGFDDWEWGVDLFADDPVTFKKLVYEMRFDEASVWYGEFGPFWTGLQFSPAELPRYLDGEVPRLLEE